MEIINVIQGTDQWHQEKLGKPSASNASKILTNEGRQSKQREGYLYQLASEIITGVSEESYQNANMVTGNEREQESRALYELIYGVEVTQVGVVYKDNERKFLCSPDGIIENKYGLEMKNPLPKTQVKYLLDENLPSEYFSQVQFSLYVCEFEFWDFLSHSPALRPLIIRVHRDEKFIKALKVELEIFCENLEDVVNKIR